MVSLLSIFSGLQMHVSSTDVMQEPLSWELLRYWKRTHGEEGPQCVRPAPIFVARCKGRVRGFAALGANPIYSFPVIEPLFADNFRVCMKLVDAMESFLTKAGFPYHLFWVDPEKNYAFLRIVERAALGERLMVDDLGRVWFKQTLPRGRPRGDLRLVAA